MTTEERVRSVIRDIPDFPQPGILFKDITPILMDATLCDEIAGLIHSAFRNHKIDAIVGVESRGFLFGMLVAQKFNVPFIPVRKKGKLPARTISYEYKLEYGSAVVEIHEDAIPAGSRVLIHDDLLATGGTAAAAAELVKQLKGEVAGFAFVVGLDFLHGKTSIAPYSQEVYTVVNY
jgi:adenine phosphoribosyltransferase